ncbi:MAG: virulence RhuM family protein [Bacteroidales bacterium]|nr:virulence RhuM family protein [Bacteroidales bacterium]
MSNEIILYQSDDLQKRIELRIDSEKETFWLSLNQISELFERDKSVISRHLKNIFKEQELIRDSVVAFFATTASDGKTYNVEHFNLDAVLSVGYRVNSKRGTQFRIWATNVLRDYMLKGYALNQRVNRIENTVESLANKVQEIDFQIKSKDLPDKGLYFDGQVYDAYQFVSEIIKNAKSSIILIDNYVDDTVLTLLSKRKKNVQVTIYTAKITKQLSLDVEKHNSQYPKLIIKLFKQSHDRFLIIDRKELYHIGASLKDLGKRWFGFSRMDSLCGDILNKLK